MELRNRKRLAKASEKWRERYYKRIYVSSSLKPEKKIAKKSTKKVRRGSKKPTHYARMIAQALLDAKNPRTGLGLPSIAGFVFRNYKVKDDAERYIKLALKRGVDAGTISRIRNSYRLTSKGRKKLLPPSARRKLEGSKKEKSSRKKKNDKKKKEKKEDKKKGTKRKSTDSKKKDDKKKAASKSPASKRSKKGKKDESGEKELRAPTRKLTRQPSTSIMPGPKLRAGGGSKIQIIFSFDTTGSMYGCLEEVRQKVSEVIRVLLGDIPGIQIGIIAHGDYEQGGTKEPYVIKTFDFSTDAESIVNFVKTVERTSGGDTPECYELVLQEAKKFSWEDGYFRALVVIGDAPPHKKNEYRKIDWEQELKELAALDVKVYAVQAGSFGSKEVEKFHSSLAEVSGGSHLKLSEFGRMREMFMGICYREAAEVQYKQHNAQIASLKRTDSAQLLLPEEMKGKKFKFTDEEVLAIHNAIHDRECNSVTVKGNSYDITRGEAGCRFTRVEGVTFVEQNKDKDSKYARMAIEGRSITWICKKGRWGLVIDSEIVRK